jgi:hypothetical protein
MLFRFSIKARKKNQYCIPLKKIYKDHMSRIIGEEIRSFDNIKVSYTLSSPSSFAQFNGLQFS